jgi:hypothetical protein
MAVKPKSPRICLITSYGSLGSVMPKKTPETESSLPADVVSKVMREMGRKGGKATGVPKGFGSLTPAQLKKISKAAAEKRWGKKASSGGATKPRS